MKFPFSSFILLALLTFLNSSCSDNQNNSNKESSLENKLKTYNYGSISFSYPSEWKLMVDTLGNKIHLVRTNEKDSSLLSYDIAMSITGKIYKSNGNFESYVHEEMKKLQELYYLKIDKEENLPIKSRNAYEFAAHYATDSGNNEIADIVYIEGSYENLIVFSTGEEKYRNESLSIIKNISLK